MIRFPPFYSTGTGTFWEPKSLLISNGGFRNRIGFVRFGDLINLRKVDLGRHLGAEVGFADQGLEDGLDARTEGEIAVRIYTPDRDVFKDRRTFSIDGVWLASPAKALLDCAGLGYAGRDLTQKLVEIYDQL